MPAQISPFHDHDSAREELASFLVSQFNGDAAAWSRRFVHWWDENPHAHAHPCRGWCLRDGGRLVGYLGTIPALYEDVEGKPVPALIATSWAVEEGHRQAALPMGLMLQRLGREVMLVDTTPSPEVQTLLSRWGWQSRVNVRRSLVVRGVSVAMLAEMMNADLSDLGQGLEITRDLTRVKRVCSERPQRCIQKHITPEYLRWYCSAPTREHHFLGVVDAEGQLTSYLMLMPKTVKGLPTWKVMDWFTTRPTNRELLALVGWLISQSPTEHGNWWPFVSLAAFLPEDPWLGVPRAYQREERVSHFYSLPPALKDQPIRSVMAEGDWGL